MLKKITIIVAILLLLGLLIFIIIKGFRNNEEIKNIKELHYSYSNGYAMYAYTTYDLICKNNTCKVTIKPYGIPDEEAKTFNVDDETMKEIEKVLNDYKVRSWDGFQKSDPDVLDGNSFSFSLSLENGDYISASGYMKYPKNYRVVGSRLDDIFNRIYEE